MIIFLSDLHLDDGSAGTHNLDHEAFDVFFSDLKSIVKWRNIKKLQLVLLGDIFDLLRTSYWINGNVPIYEKPWGSDSTSDAVLKHTANILDGIVRKNGEALAVFRNNIAELRKNNVDAEVVYVPGNHDRLLNLSSTTRMKTRAALGINGNGRFQHTFKDREHSVFAQHGHEYDVYNFEPLGDERSDPYDRTPIGDPITTELVTRLPLLVRKNAEQARIPAPVVDGLQQSLEQIEDVRPLRAVLEWLVDNVKRTEAFRTHEYDIRRVTEDSLDTTIRQFNDLSFVRRWMNDHDRLTSWTDEADRLQGPLWIAEKLDVLSHSMIFDFAEKVASHFSEDHQANAAMRILEESQGSLRHVVMGHTHEPKQVAMGVTANGQPQVYLNTGTWRPTHHRCVEGGFASWKEMTYCIVYEPKERDSDAPSFETWSGTLG